VAVLTAALVAYNYLVTPLDVVWSVIMLRMGIS
jgi:hypothetical protein